MGPGRLYLQLMSDTSTAAAPAGREDGDESDDSRDSEGIAAPSTGTQLQVLPWVGGYPCPLFAPSVDDPPRVRASMLELTMRRSARLVEPTV